MVEAFICQVEMFFKKTIIKNHDFFCLSSCDVVTFAVRMATFRIFECIISLKKIRFLLLKMNAIKHLKVKSKIPIISKTCWIGAKFL